MKAIVLAGGYATRLWPITRHRPKMFLPLGEAAIIDRIFGELERDDRISDVYVSTNERFAKAFETHLSDSDFEKPTLSIERTETEDEKLGVVGALAQLVERERIDEDTIVIAGDNLISFDLGDFIDFFESKGAPTLAAYDVGSRERAKSYGLVELDGDRVVDFQEKPDHPNSTLVSIACYGFTADAIDRLDEYLKEGNNPDEPGWFLQWLQTREPVYAFTFDDAWFDIGTPDSYLEALEWVSDGDPQIAPTATVENTRIGQNVHVMAGAEVRDASVENAVLFPGTTVQDAAIEDSIIDEKTHIDGVDLDNSVVGPYTSLMDGIERD